MEIKQLCEMIDGQAFALRHALAVRDAALWRLRWRHANTMVMLFEGMLNVGYYTAYGEGPYTVQHVEEVTPGKFIDFKHMPQEWAKIWQSVAEKLITKVREANAALKQMEAKGGVLVKALEVSDGSP